MMMMSIVVITIATTMMLIAMLMVVMMLAMMAMMAILVMFAMYCHPLFSNHTSGHPEPKTHEVFYCGVERDTFVCLTSVQIQGNTGYGDLNHHQG